MRHPHPLAELGRALAQVIELVAPRLGELGRLLLDHVEQARDLLAEIGYPDPPGDRTWGFRSNAGALPPPSVRHKTPQYDQLLADRSPAIEFWSKTKKITTKWMAGASSNWMS